MKQMPLSDEQRQEVLAELRTTREMLAGIPSRLDDIEDKGRHTRWIAYGLAAGLAAGGFVFLYERSVDNRNLIDLQNEYDVASCERVNVSRAGQREQWEDVRTLLIDLGAGRDTRRLADGLVSNAYENFPDLDCGPVKEGKAPTAKPTTPGGPQ